MIRKTDATIMDALSQVVKGKRTPEIIAEKVKAEHTITDKKYDSVMKNYYGVITEKKDDKKKDDKKDEKIPKGKEEKIMCLASDMKAQSPKLMWAQAIKNATMKVEDDEKESAKQEAGLAGAKEKAKDIIKKFKEVEKECNKFKAELEKLAKDHPGLKDVKNVAEILDIKEDEKEDDKEDKKEKKAKKEDKDDMKAVEKKDDENKDEKKEEETKPEMKAIEKKEDEKKPEEKTETAKCACADASKPAAEPAKEEDINKAIEEANKEIQTAEKILATK